MRLSEVGKRYARGGPWVLRGVELSVGPGELVRIDGANGSGKSTLLRLAAGIERPSAGTVALGARRAYVPERFPPALPFDARGYLHRMARIQGLSAAEAERRTAYWLDRLGIADRAATPIARLSKGTCQKVAVAQALLAEAEVLVLDEAWTGLDQPARALLDDAVAERVAGGGRVLFVDHDPHRLAGLATAAYVVAGGGLRPASGTPDEPSTALRRAAGTPGKPSGPRVRIEAEGPLPARLPGEPLCRPLVDGATLLEVSAQHSDALLRRLLTAHPSAHIRLVVPVEEGS